MGVLVAAILYRRWGTLLGFAVIMLSLLIPAYSPWRLVRMAVGAALVLARVPLVLLRVRRERREG